MTVYLFAHHSREEQSDQPIVNSGRVASEPTKALTLLHFLVFILVFCRILIVDDNTDLAETMSMMLGICGFQTATAHTGRLGIAVARSFRPDVVLLDIGLPDITGYEVVAALRQDASMTSTLIIAISAEEPENHTQRAIQAGFNHYLVKPVDLDFLLRLIAQ